MPNGLMSRLTGALDEQARSLTPYWNSGKLKLHIYSTTNINDDYLKLIYFTVNNFDRSDSSDLGILADRMT